VFKADALKQPLNGPKKAIADLNAPKGQIRNFAIRIDNDEFRPHYEILIVKNVELMPKEANEAIWYYLPNMSEIFNND